MIHLALWLVSAAVVAFAAFLALMLVVALIAQIAQDVRDARESPANHVKAKWVAAVAAFFAALAVSVLIDIKVLKDGLRLTAFVVVGTAYSPVIWLLCRGARWVWWRMAAAVTRALP